MAADGRLSCSIAIRPSPSAPAHAAGHRCGARQPVGLHETCALHWVSVTTKDFWKMVIRCKNKAPAITQDDRVSVRRPSRAVLHWILLP
jgi:hypothetical protein